MSRLRVKCPGCSAELLVKREMIGTIGVCHRCKAEFTITIETLTAKSEPELHITIPSDSLPGLAFPSKCALCLDGSASEQISIIETTSFLRSLSYPYPYGGIIILLIFFAVGIATVVVAGIVPNMFGYSSFSLGVGRLIWWVISICVIIILRWRALKSCRSVKISFCKSCLVRWNTRRMFKHIVDIVFLLSMPALGLCLALDDDKYTQVLGLFFLITAAISGFAIFYCNWWFHRFDPPLKLHKSSGGKSVLFLRNVFFAKEIIDKNANLALKIEMV